MRECLAADPSPARAHATVSRLLASRTEAVTLFAVGAAQPVLLQQPDQIHALLSLLCEWGWIKAGACEACVDPAEGA